MDQFYYDRRLETLTARITALEPRIARARQSVRRLETEQVPAGASAARAAQLSAARSRTTTLEERGRQLRVAEAALRAELAELT